MRNDNAPGWMNDWPIVTMMWRNGEAARGVWKIAARSRLPDFRQPAPPAGGRPVIRTGS